MHAKTRSPARPLIFALLALLAVLATVVLVTRGHIAHPLLMHYFGHPAAMHFHGKAP